MVGPLAKFFPARARLAGDRRRGAGGGRGVDSLVVDADAAVLMQSEVHDRSLDGPLQHAVPSKHVQVLGRLVLSRHLVDHLPHAQVFHGTFTDPTKTAFTALKSLRSGCTKLS